MLKCCTSVVTVETYLGLTSCIKAFSRAKEYSIAGMTEQIQTAARIESELHQNLLLKGGGE